jgi:hypothetical protein
VQLHRDIALELIDVGFKALATRVEVWFEIAQDGLKRAFAMTLFPFPCRGPSHLAQTGWQNGAGGTVFSAITSSRRSLQVCSAVSRMTLVLVLP